MIGATGWDNPCPQLLPAISPALQFQDGRRQHSRAGRIFKKPEGQLINLLSKEGFMNKIEGEETRNAKSVLSASYSDKGGMIVQAITESVQRDPHVLVEKFSKSGKFYKASRKSLKSRICIVQ